MRVEARVWEKIVVFAKTYGPWAVIAGGSEGTGRAFAEQVAAAGVNCVLIAKNGPLEQTAEDIRRETGVEVVTALVDLSALDAADQIFAAVGDREVGLFINNAGADWQGERFLEEDIESWLQLSRINVDTMLRCAHRFGGAMRARRRGGILIVNSGACYGGSKYLAIYCAAKAFQLNFAEAFWSEMQPYNVDVCTIVLGRTNTPGYHSRRAARGVFVGIDGLASPEDVAAQGLARLPHGPITNVGQEDHEDGYLTYSAAKRREKVVAMETFVMQDSGYKRETDL
jgi:short-subunit dehydrogenase